MKIYLKQIKKYRKEIEMIDEEISTLPDGHLGIKKTTFYQIVGRNHRGITKQTDIIIQLARKRYLELRKEQLVENLNTDEVLAFQSQFDLISTLPTAYRQLPISYFFHPNITSWMNQAHQPNTLNSEHAKFFFNGTDFRSLAERTIAETLHGYNIPYKYDTVVDLIDKKVSPDFIVKNPFTNETIIWEHFGAFNHEKYAESMNNKLDTYEKSGFTSGENLIITFEYHIRDVSRIKGLIEDFIL